MVAGPATAPWAAISSVVVSGEVNGQDGAIYAVRATLLLNSGELEGELTLPQSNRRAPFRTNVRATRFDRAEVGLVAQALAELLDHYDQAHVAAVLRSPGVSLTVTAIA